MFFTAILVIIGVVIHFLKPDILWVYLLFMAAEASVAAGNAANKKGVVTLIEDLESRVLELEEKVDPSSDSDEDDM